MRAPVKLAGFAAGLAVLFGAGVGIGALTDREPTAQAAHPAGGHDSGGHDSGMHGASGDPTEQPAPAGLQSSQAGYTLEPIEAPTAAGQPGTLRFRLTDPHGMPVTGYDTLHEKQLHLIVVRADTADFRHVHPTLAPDGTWSIDWTWPEAGSYRVYADFQPAGGPGQLTLTRTVEVAGDYVPKPLPAANRSAEVDGYTVTLAGDPTTTGGPLTFSVGRDGRPVTDLEPYLGAYGHLVALRVGDLAYLHAHPDAATGQGQGGPAGPDVAFHVQAPSTGSYRLFLDFAHRGAVHTAEFRTDATG